MLNILSLTKARHSNTQPPTDVIPREESPAYRRLVTDFAELDTIPSTCKVTLPDPDNLLHFILTITPDDGFYRGGRFIFSVDVPSGYPHAPPKVKCTQTIYHPNIDLNGNVCLNILREDWTPVLTILTVILGMAFLFSYPNPDEPLNKEASEILKKSVNTFKSNVANTMGGGKLNNTQFTRVLI